MPLAPLYKTVRRYGKSQRANYGGIKLIYLDAKMFVISSLLTTSINLPT